MTSLRLATITMPTAVLGPENQLPPLFGTGNRGYQVDMSAASDTIRSGSQYGRVESISPYFMQDDYGRRHETVEHPVAILENEMLTATFLLNAGGRLWSLVHRPSGRELLFRNDVMQPANVSLRNAWVAGGIEWNVGTIGHAPGTMSPIHAARVRHPDGTPVLRLWEYDRIRRVVYQIDAHLPEDSDSLFVHVRLVNLNDTVTPTYWWTNIAVPQTDRSRVISCADRAWNYSYGDRLAQVPVVDDENDIDCSYPARGHDAADFFFDTTGTEIPWIAAFDEDGVGFRQVSSRELRGRKLFRWGSGAGGERWQAWLSGPQQSYFEIQAGLAQTQFEHVPLPAAGEISWVEAYGQIEMPSSRVHGRWSDARASAQEAVSKLVPAEMLRAEQLVASQVARQAVDEVLHAGSGWGALDSELSSVLGETTRDLSATPFPSHTMTSAQHQWIELLRTGRFPHSDPGAFPASFQIDERWEPYLKSAKSGWVEPALLGAMYAAHGDLSRAEQSWIDSAAALPNVVALRNLGALRRHQGDAEGARRFYDHALTIAPHLRPLVVEALRSFLEADDASTVISIVDALPTDVAAHPRVRQLEAMAAIASGDLDRAGTILESGLEIPDLREGETSLVETWWDYQAALFSRSNQVEVTPELRARIAETVPVPQSLDFRMRAEVPAPVTME